MLPEGTGKMSVAGITGHNLSLGDGIAFLKKLLRPGYFLQSDIASHGRIGVLLKNTGNIVRI